MATPSKPVLLTIPRYIELYGGSRSTTYRQIADSTIKAVHIGDRRMIVVASADAMVERAIEAAGGKAGPTPEEGRQELARQREIVRERIKNTGAPDKGDRL